ncbi:unnamed protein product [Dicrocoelium dendriticum]|nr:unnamed protein product [Dicrocoelium dendriticum]
MENLLLVVEERNRAEADLEHGEWVGPTTAEGIDALGRPCSRLTSEHLEPRVGDKTAKADEQMWGEKTVELLRLEEETYKSKDRKTTRSERVTQRKKRWNRLDYFSATSSDKTPM